MGTVLGRPLACQVARPACRSLNGLRHEFLEAAGFVEFEVESLPFTIHYPSVEAWWEASNDMSLRVQERSTRAHDSEIIESLRAKARPWAAEDGSLAVPARTWVATATA